MEIQRYRKIVYILIIILLFTLLYSIIIIQPSTESWAASVSNEISLDNLRQSQKNIEAQNNLKDNSGLKRIKVMEELQGHKMDENYQELIIVKNIFNLVNKADEENEKVLEEVITPEVKEKEDDENNLNVQRKEDEEKRESEIFQLPNPFNLLGISINSSDKMAIIVNYNTSMTYLIKPGDIIDGYLIKAIDFNQVIMEKSDQEIVVVFQK